MRTSANHLSVQRHGSAALSGGLPTWPGRYAVGLAHCVLRTTCVPRRIPKERAVQTHQIMRFKVPSGDVAAVTERKMFMALPELGLVIKEKGRMVPNPDSTLLPMAYTTLGLL